MFLTAGDLRKFLEHVEDTRPLMLTRDNSYDLTPGQRVQAVDLTEVYDGLLDAKAHVTRGS